VAFTTNPIYCLFHGELCLFRHVCETAKKQLLAPSSLPSSPAKWNTSAPTGWIFMEFDISIFFENLSQKSQFH
jgi:hypothetical protein